MSSPSIMLLHGLTGMPSMLRPLVRALEAEKMKVVTPTIAGHCSTTAELAKTSLEEWITSVETPFLELTERDGPIFIGGISLGGLLSLELSLRYPDKVRGCILMATPLDLPRWLKTAFFCIHASPARFLYKGQKRWDKGILDPMGRKEFECYDYFPFRSIQNLFKLRSQVIKRLSHLTVPLLAIHSTGDKTVPYSSIEVIRKHYHGPYLEVVTLEKSQHVITLDLERNILAAACSRFIHRETLSVIEN